MSFSSLPDTKNLRKVLISITSDIESSFLERRGRKNSHKSNPLEELSDAISELSSREQDLKAAAGIALMLLEANEEMQEKLQNTEKKNQESEARCHHYLMEVDFLAESSLKNEQKIKELKSALINAENSIFLQAQQIHLLNEHKKGRQEEQDDEQHFELQKKFEELAKKNEEVDRQCFRLKDQLKTAENSLKESEENNRELKQKLKKSQEKIELHRSQQKSLKSELEHSENNREACESLLKQANITIQKLKMYTERLEEEMSIHDIKKVHTKSQANNDSSLYSELSMLEDELENEESVEDSNFWKKTSGSSRFFSIHSYTKYSSFCSAGSISVLPSKPQRKPAPEEYFSLATQAVKMNSPYMESICCVPTTQLYEKAIRDEVPFHKWHEWISKQLGLIYIDVIYKKNAKFSWTKQSQKKFQVSPT